MDTLIHKPDGSLVSKDPCREIGKRFCHRTLGLCVVTKESVEKWDEMLRHNPNFRGVYMSFVEKHNGEVMWDPKDAFMSLDE